ncbi:MAG: hypothetical protein OEN50_10475 [Deltaproteobacteria bacterium]|nr:hypothetical protein [Deltaproteobacteria bacterium]
MASAKKKSTTKKKAKATKKTAAKKKTANPTKAEPTEGELVTVRDIAKAAKVEPRILRKALRRSPIAKPGKSWRWPADHKDLKKVRELAGKL